jgi:hypothetical protein
LNPNQSVARARGVPAPQDEAEGRQVAEREQAHKRRGR